MKKPTKKQLVLNMLRSAGKGGVDNRELNHAGVWRYSARIKELRDEGHNIKTQRLDHGHFRFILTEPSRSSGHDSANQAEGKSPQEPEPSEGAIPDAPSGDPLFSVAPHEARAGERMYADPDTRD